MWPWTKKKTEPVIEQKPLEDRFRRLQQDFDDLSVAWMKHKKEVDLALADFDDRVYPLLKKLNQRNAVRKHREDDEEEKTDLYNGVFIREH